MTAERLARDEHDLRQRAALVGRVHLGHRDDVAAAKRLVARGIGRILEPRPGEHCEGYTR